MNATVPALWGPARTYALMAAQGGRLGQIDAGQDILRAAQAAVETPEVRKTILFAPLYDISEKIKNERAWDAGDFRDLVAAGQQRLAFVDALGKAEKALTEQQRIWESSHQNPDALRAAQAQVDSLQVQLAEATAKVADLRTTVNGRAQTISSLRADADRVIASLPQEFQLEGRRIIDPCTPGAAMQGAARGRVRVPVIVRNSAQMGSHGLQLMSIPIAGAKSKAFAPPRPSHLLPAGTKLGQLVTVNPNVQVTVQTGIEKYLFPVGLMAAGGAAFIVGTVIPKDYKLVTTLAGLGLIGWGVYVLIKGGTSGAAAPQPGAPAPTPPPPTGATPVEASPQPFVPPSVPAFNQIQTELVSPAQDGNVSSVGTFLGIGTKKIPVLMRFYNPTSESVTFNLVFDWTEQGSSFGYSLSPLNGSKEFQVTLGPGEQKNQEFELPVVTSGSTGQMDVGLSVYKKRLPNENKFLIMTRTFTVN